MQAEKYAAMQRMRTAHQSHAYYYRSIFLGRCGSLIVHEYYTLLSMTYSSFVNRAGQLN